MKTRLLKLIPGGMVALLCAMSLAPLAHAEDVPHSDCGSAFVPEGVSWDNPVYHTDFDNPADLRDWRLEGGSDMSISQGRLVLESPPGATTPGDNTGHLVCWLDREMPGDFLLEFSFRPKYPKQGLAIVFFNARGVSGEGVFDLSIRNRDGTFIQYLRSDLNNYHISYFADDRGTSHLRKSHGAHMLATGCDLVAGGETAVFRMVRIYKRGGKIRLSVNGVLALAYDDDGDRFGPIWRHSGWMGLRQMSHTERGEYDHVTVWPLNP